MSPEPAGFLAPAPYVMLPAWLPLALLAWAVHMVVFHGVGLAFEWCDRTGGLDRFKVRPVDRLSYSALLPRVLFNQVVLLLPFMMVCEWMGWAFVGTPRLSAIQFIAGLLLMPVGHDVVQYIGHRYVLHSPHCRWLGHSLHHGTDASRSIGACYMSCGDFFLNIVTPYLVPLIAIGGGGSDILFHVLVPCAGAVGGLYEHSGYDFVPEAGEKRTWWGRLLSRIPAAAISSYAHGQHHSRSMVSFSDGFGSPGLCDTICSTRWDFVPEHRRTP